MYDELDKDSRNIWKTYLPESRIIASGEKDNFWEMGEYGPCGPCTEIHYDRIGGRDASALVNMDDPNVLEIWNIVFMEFNRTPSALLPLEVKKIDTGIGLERLLSILIDVKSNYLIDTFQAIIKLAEERSGKTYVDSDEKSNETVAFRVIADHSRTIAICVHYQVIFSNEGIGYVLRRILRRMMRFADEVLNLSNEDLIDLICLAAEVLDLGKLETHAIKAEIDSFHKTLKKGLEKFNKIAETKGKIDATDMFVLFDTYGFSKDLTEIIAAERNIECNEKGFEELLQQQKERSKGHKEEFITVNFDFPKTDDSFKYDEKNLNNFSEGVKLEAIVLNNELTQEIESKDEIFTLIFNKTCFYGECGGQVGDTGKIKFTYGKEECIVNVLDTKILRGYTVHTCELVSKTLRTEGITKIQMSVDTERREKIRNNHSSCHIVGTLIKQIVDGQCEQQGSFVDEDKCIRF